MSARASSGVNPRPKSSRTGAKTSSSVGGARAGAPKSGRLSGSGRTGSASAAGGGGPTIRRRPAASPSGTTSTGSRSLGRPKRVTTPERGAHRPKSPATGSSRLAGEGRLATTPDEVSKEDLPLTETVLGAALVKEFLVRHGLKRTIRALLQEVGENAVTDEKAVLTTDHFKRISSRSELVRTLRISKAVRANDKSELRCKTSIELISRELMNGRMTSEPSTEDDLPVVLEAFAEREASNGSVEEAGHQLQQRGILDTGDESRRAEQEARKHAAADARRRAESEEERQRQEERLREEERREAEAEKERPPSREEALERIAEMERELAEQNQRERIKAEAEKEAERQRLAEIEQARKARAERAAAKKAAMKAKAEAEEAKRKAEADAAAAAAAAAAEERAEEARRREEEAEEERRRAQAEEEAEEERRRAAAAAEEERRRVEAEASKARAELEEAEGEDEASAVAAGESPESEETSPPIGDEDSDPGPMDADEAPAPISSEDVAALHAILFGKDQAPSRTFPPDWQQGFISRVAYDDGGPKDTKVELNDTSVCRYGLVQIHGGSCGVMGPVQAFTLRAQLEHTAAKKPEELYLPQSKTSQEFVAAGVADILWHIALVSSPSAPQVRLATMRGERLRYDLSAIHVQRFRSKQRLREQLLAEPQWWFHENSHATANLTCSAVLTRDVRVLAQEDFDVYGSDGPAEATLMGRHGYCSQELVNLLLCGRAVMNTFGGDKNLDDGLLLRGIPEEAERPLAVGFLSTMEKFGNTQIANRYKTPVAPNIWVLFMESHYSVLFTLEKELPSLGAAVEKPFDVFYFDQLGNQTEEYRITVTGKPRKGGDEGSQSESEDESSVDSDLIPPVEDCLSTIWPDTTFDWNGSEPLL